MMSSVVFGKSGRASGKRCRGRSGLREPARSVAVLFRRDGTGEPGGRGVLPLQKEKRGAAAQRRPARSERKNAFFRETTGRMV